MGEHDINARLGVGILEHQGAIVVDRHSSVRRIRSRRSQRHTCLIGGHIHLVRPHHDALVVPSAQVIRLEPPHRTVALVALSSPVSFGDPVAGVQYVAPDPRVPEDDALGIPSAPADPDILKQLPTDPVG